jgi:hypothetical protein
VVTEPPPFSTRNLFSNLKISSSNTLNSDIFFFWTLPKFSLAMSYWPKKF